MLRRSWVLALGLGISALFLWLALRGTDLAVIGQALARSNPWYALPLLATFGLYFWLKAWRWGMLLTPIRKMPTAAVLPATVIGYMGNILLPFYLGEFVRVHMLAKRQQFNVSTLLATLVLERVFDLLTILMIIGVVLVAGARIPAELQSVGYFIAIVALVVLAMVLGFALWTEMFVALTSRVATLLPDQAARFLVAQVSLGAEGLRAIGRPALLLRVLITSIGQWVVMGLCIFIGILALAIDAPLSAGFVVLALATAGMTLPNSPGFIGTIQLAFTLGLQPYGVDANDAFAASVFFHVLANVSIIVAGAYFLKRTGESLSEMRKDASTPSNSTDT